MSTDENPERVFPELGDESIFYLNQQFSRSQVQSKHALKILQGNLVLASFVLVVLLYVENQGLAGVGVEDIDFYAVLGVVFWIMSVGAAFSAYMNSQASMNPTLSIFRNYLSGDIDDTEFKELVALVSAKAKHTGGEVYWLLLSSLGALLLAIYWLALSAVNEVTNTPISMVTAFGPLALIICLGVLPLVVLTAIAYARPDIVYLDFSFRDELTEGENQNEPGPENVS